MTGKNVKLAFDFSTTHLFLELATIDVYIATCLLVLHLHDTMLGELALSVKQFLEGISTPGS